MQSPTPPQAPLLSQNLPCIRFLGNTGSVLHLRSTGVGHMLVSFLLGVLLSELGLRGAAVGL